MIPFKETVFMLAFLTHMQYRSPDDAKHSRDAIHLLSLLPGNTKEEIELSILYKEKFRYPENSIPESLNSPPRD